MLSHFETVHNWHVTVGYDDFVRELEELFLLFLVQSNLEALKLCNLI